MNYLPRRNEIKTPNPPINPKPKINKPTGRPDASVCSSKDGRTKGAGTVNVTKRVGVTGIINAATRVGLIVGVEAGVGVEGAAKIGRLPDLTIFTNGPYTHATESVTPG